MFVDTYVKHNLYERNLSRIMSFVICSYNNFKFQIDKE